MTQENFIAEYKALQARKQEIEDRMSAIEREYVRTLPFKVGDRVRVVCHNSHYDSTEGGWITRIRPTPGWDNGGKRFYITVVEPRKDGTPSRRPRELRFIRPEEVEVLEAAAPSR